jgi:hypothetical protein
MKHLKTFVLLFLFSASIFILLVPTIFAAATTTWTATPQHVTEGSTVSLVLTLNGYIASHTYYFVVNVTDPNGSDSAANRTIQTDVSGNAVLTIHYPTDFNKGPKAGTNLTGSYVAAVTATSANPPSGTLTFTVGLTDQLSYQRSLKARITAYGYIPGKEATVNLTKGATTIFSHRRDVINATGYVNDFWNVPVVTGTDGSYTVTVSKNVTVPKAVPDTQVFTVIPAILIVSNLNPASISGKIETNVVRGNTTFAVFNVTYPNGTAVVNPSSTSSLLLFSPGSSPTIYTMSAGYSTTLKAFFTTAGQHTYPINDPTGTWSLRVIANQTLDTYGNQGPDINATTTFSVEPLTLNTAISTLKTSYNRTTLFNVTATVSYPTSDTFGSSSGPVSANLTSGTHMIKKSLTFNPTSQTWLGNLTISPDFPLGYAILQISARDAYGNSGTNSSLTILVTVTTIIVHQAPFSVNGTNLYPFQTLTIHINATYINNQKLIPGSGGLGKITFNLPGGRTITIALSLETNGNLTGQYTIRDTDPLGRWNLTVGRWQLNDGNGNVNSKSVLGPIVTVLPILLRFDSSYFKAPGNITVTGDKVTLGIAFHYPNGTNTLNLIVNTTIFANGQNNTYTFTYDSATSKYLTTIDTTGWAPGRYQVNITAYYLDYRGSQVFEITVQPTPFLLGPIIGVLLILVILGIGALEFARRGKTAAE